MSKIQILWAVLVALNFGISIPWQWRDKYDRAILSFAWACLMLATYKGILL